MDSQLEAHIGAYSRLDRRELEVNEVGLTQKKARWIEATGGGMRRWLVNRKRTVAKPVRRSYTVQKYAKEDPDTGKVEVKYKWETLTVFINGEPIAKSLIMRDCAICGCQFPIEAYPFLFDDAYDSMGLPDKIVKEAQERGHRLRRCSICRAEHGEPARWVRSASLVRDLKVRLEAMGYQLVKGRKPAGPMQVTWMQLYREPITVDLQDEALRNRAELPHQPSVWEKQPVLEQEFRGVTMIRESAIGIAFFETASRKVEVSPERVLALEEYDKQSEAGLLDADNPRNFARTWRQPMDAEAEAERMARELELRTMLEDAEFSDSPLGKWVRQREASQRTTLEDGCHA